MEGWRKRERGEGGPERGDGEREERDEGVRGEGGQGEREEDADGCWGLPPPGWAWGWPGAPPSPRAHTHPVLTLAKSRCGSAMPTGPPALRGGHTHTHTTTQPQNGGLGGVRALTVPAGGQEALRKIITTLAVKNEEIQNFIYSLKQMLQNVEVPTALPLPPRGGPGGLWGCSR